MKLHSSYHRPYLDLRPIHGMILGRSHSRGVDVAAGVCMLVLLLGQSTGCDRSPQEATGAKVASEPVAVAGPPLVRLDPAKLERNRIEVRPVTRGVFRTFRVFPGVVNPNENELAEITSLVRGRVVDVYADLGQQVKAGTMLALLYSSEIGIAQSAYLKAKAKLYVAERAYKRARLLLKEKVIGQAEAQRRESELISTRADAREARDRLLLLGMADKEIGQLEKDETIHSYVPIVPPFNGRVIARNITRGEVVNTTEKLFVVADLSNLWVVANIPEKDIPFIHHDQAAHPQATEVQVSAYAHEVFKGRITYVGDVLHSATRTLRIRVEVPNPEGRLKPEMFASVRIYSAPEPNVLTIPSTAVQQDKGKAVVFVQVDEQRFAQRDVKLDSESGDVLKVLDGLKEGELVVVSGAFVLKSEFANQHQGGLVE